MSNPSTSRPSPPQQPIRSLSTTRKGQRTRRHFPKTQSIYLLPTSPRSLSSRLIRPQHDDGGNDSGGSGSEDPEEMSLKRSKKGWKTRKRKERDEIQALSNPILECESSHLSSFIASHLARFCLPVSQIHQDHPTHFPLPVRLVYPDVYQQRTPQLYPQT
jgi:hypothetical protein